MLPLTFKFDFEDLDFDESDLKRRIGLNMTMIIGIDKSFKFSFIIQSRFMVYAPTSYKYKDLPK
jgi:hypothetical protein